MSLAAANDDVEGAGESPEQEQQQQQRIPGQGEPEQRLDAEAAQAAVAVNAAAALLRIARDAQPIAVRHIIGGRMAAEEVAAGINLAQMANESDPRANVADARAAAAAFYAREAGGGVACSVGGASGCAAATSSARLCTDASSASSAPQSETAGTGSGTVTTRCHVYTSSVATTTGAIRGSSGGAGLQSPTPSNNVLVYEAPTMARDHFRSLNDMRLQSLLCDVVLVVNDVEIAAHRSVLASVSPYFYAMFTGEMAEAEQERVCMHSIDPKALALLVQFAYSR